MPAVPRAAPQRQGKPSTGPRGPRHYMSCSLLRGVKSQGDPELALSLQCQMRRPWGHVTGKDVRGLHSPGEPQAPLPKGRPSCHFPTGVECRLGTPNAYPGVGVWKLCPSPACLQGSIGSHVWGLLVLGSPRGPMGPGLGVLGCIRRRQPLERRRHFRPTTACLALSKQIPRRSPGPRQTLPGDNEVCP